MKDLADILFAVRPEQTIPAAGAVLVSEPFVSQTYFTHSVVSIIDYAPDDGANGVVLNNSIEYCLDDLLDGVTTPDIPVFCGGPIGHDRLFFIHTLGPEIIPGARLYSPGLYVGGNFRAAKEYVNGGYPVDGYIRFFVGYSSWDPEQLEAEMRSGLWASVPKTIKPENLLQGRGDRFWHNTVSLLGERYRSWQLLPRNVVCN